MNRVFLLGRLLLAALPVASLPALAAPADRSSAVMPDAVRDLTFDQVFASPSLDGPQPRAVKVSPDGRYITLLRNRAEDRDRYDLWAFDRKSGKWRMLVDSAKIGSGRALSEAERMQRERQRVGSLKGIISYDWTQDGSAILLPLDGDLYLASIDGSVRRLTESDEDELNAALSPRGGYVSFVRDRRLWVGGLKDGGHQPITPAESAETVHWGEAEFVAQEEMDRMDGYWWSPNDDLIAVQRYDEAPVGIVTRTAIGAEGTRTYQQRYPAAGTPNALVSLHVMRPDGSARVSVDLGTDPDIYLARVDWAPDGKTLYVQRQNREQSRMDMLAVDPRTGSARVLFTETARKGSWINLTNNYRFLKDGSLVWWSERDGHGHLYHFREGTWRQLTSGDWVVTKLVSVDEKKGTIQFLGNRDDVLAPQLYAVNLATPGQPRQLTEAGWSNAASASRDGSTVLVTRSSTSQPPQTYIADENGKRLAWVEENRLGDAHPYGPYLSSHRPTTFGIIKANDGSDLHWMMITPPLQPGKRYPVFFEHYGGPHVQTVTRGWKGALAQAIVDRGYIYFEIDNRGSANRGVDFESQIREAMGSVEVQDQRAGAEYLKTLDFVDPAKIATYGWSYGGYMTLKMLEADPGFYAAGISGAPVTKWELYDTHYTERYMGDPRRVPEAYRTAGTIEQSTRIADPLLLIHGMSDDNVVLDNSMTLAARMQGNATPFEMMLYPGQTHSVRGPRISVHLWNTIFGFLERHGVTPPK
ncbi:prolyl oligopeptidase family serine peptidase [Novosphingobium sp. FGD1]|uniref:Prolyl oligopeptidase family serine peptidase n=1 Tax=Novosphingobium silvae TaxID=2692619 RepID=A0A7X4GJ52_9SPHN|nr:S9 family peptidase [Novosphingobium silvae]MYL99214.1 prolyl oligopeptidase family serine peptidase [Novosphingobium silvae]